jgi:hypothetical protein
MDLFKTWEQVNREKFTPSPLPKEEIIYAIGKESHSTIAELQKRLRYKLYWIIGGAIIISIWMLFNLQHNELLLILGIFQIQGLIFLLPIGSCYYKMTKSISITSNALSYMKTNALLISKALRLELVAGLATVPWSVMGGLLLHNYYAGNTISTALHNPAYVITIIVVLVVAIPAMFYGGQKANNYVYGQYIQQLNQNILHMETL